MPYSIDVAVPARASLGEAPLWDHEKKVLYWVDVPLGELHRLNERSNDDVVVRLDVPLGASCLTTDDTFLLAADLGIARLSADGSVSWLAHVTAGDRMNDGKVDPAGRYVVGSMTYDRSPRAALYQMTVNEESGLPELRTLIRDVHISNGLGWSPDGSCLYYIDTPTRRVDCFDYDVTSGIPERRRTLIEIGDLAGNPDGLAVDIDGGIWVVLCRGGKVCRFTPKGRLDEVIDLPVSRPTSCAFGGEGLDLLFVTTGTFAFEASDVTEEPLAGSVLCVDVGIRGLPSSRFRW